MRAGLQSPMKGTSSGWQTSRPSIVVRTRHARGQVLSALSTVAGGAKKFAGISPEAAQLSAPPTAVDTSTAPVAAPEVPLPPSASVPTPPAPAALTAPPAEVPAPPAAAPPALPPSVPTPSAAAPDPPAVSALPEASVAPAAPEVPVPSAATDLSELVPNEPPPVDAPTLQYNLPKFPDLSGATDGVSVQSSKALEDFGSQFRGVQESASGVISNALSSLDEVSSTALQSAGSLAKDLSSLTQGATESLQQATASSTSTLNSVLSAVQAQTAQSGAQLQSAVTGVQSQVVAVLPEPVRGPLRQGVDAIASTVSQHPAEIAIAAGALGASVALTRFLRRFSGLSGELQPSEVLALLADGDIALVDVRSDEARERDGIPELKNAARFKVAALPPAAVADVMRIRSGTRQVKNQTELVSEVTATLVRGLNVVKSSSTKVAILSERGDRNAVELARALRKGGQTSAFVVAGGFQGWVQEGLAVREDLSTYDVKPIEVLADSFDRFKSNLGGAGAALKSPLAAAPFVAGAAAASVAVVNYRITLEYIGIFVALYGTYRFASKYNSPQAAWKDLTGFLPKPRPATAAAATPRRKAIAPAAVATEAPAAQAPAVAAEIPAPAAESVGAEAVPAPAQQAAAAEAGAIVTPMAQVDETPGPSESDKRVAETTGTEAAAPPPPPTSAETAAVQRQEPASSTKPDEQATAAPSPELVGQASPSATSVVVDAAQSSREATPTISRSSDAEDSSLAGEEESPKGFFADDDAAPAATASSSAGEPTTPSDAEDAPKPFFSEETAPAAEASSQKAASDSAARNGAAQREPQPVSAGSSSSSSSSSS